MRGLRTQENDEFVRFFNMIQKEAERNGLVFFADCGEGNVKKIGDIECEDMFGWLIPKEEVNKFEPLFIANNVPPEWDSFSGFANWHETDTGEVYITFDDFG